MTLTLLIEAISNRLKEIFKERNINVIQYCLPHSYEAENNKLTPYVVVNPLEITDIEEGRNNQSQAKIQLIICTNSGNSDCQGYIDTLNIIEEIRQNLLTSRRLENRYMLGMPLNSKLEEKDMYPYFIGYMNTVWIIPQPQSDILGKLINQPMPPRRER